MKGSRQNCKAAGIFCMLLLVVISCSKKERVPVGVLSKPEMVKVLAEIYVAEEKVNKLALKSDSAKIVFEKIKGKIFDKMNVPDSVFKKSMNYYTEHPKEMELIYTALVDSLNLSEQRESVREKPTGKPKSKGDSLIK